MNAAYPLNCLSELYEGVSIIEVIIFPCSKKLHFSIELSSSTNTFDFSYIYIFLYLKLLTHVQVMTPLIPSEMSLHWRFPLPLSPTSVIYSILQITIVTYFHSRWQLSYSLYLIMKNHHYNMNIHVYKCGYDFYRES